MSKNFIPKALKPAVVFFVGFANRIAYGEACRGCKVTATDGDYVEIDVVREFLSGVQWYGGADEHKHIRCIWHAVTKSYTVTYGARRRTTHANTSCAGYISST